MNNFQIQTALSDADREAIIAGVVARIKPLIDARPELVGGDIMSQMLGVSVPTLDRLRKAGRIPSLKIGNRRLYDPTAVIAALEAGNGEGDSHE